MDDRETSPAENGGFDETELAAQLRSYADGLEAAHRAGRLSSAPPVAATPPGTPVVDLGDRPLRPGRRWPIRIVAPAIAAAVMVGAIGWWSNGRDTTAVSTDSPTTTATSTSTTTTASQPTSTQQTSTSSPGDEVEPFPENLASAPALLPDMTRWAVAGHYPSEDPGPYDQDGIWVWRVDDTLVTLSENVAEYGTSDRDEALFDSSGSRSSLHWVEEGVNYDIQAIDMTESRLRATLAELTRTDNGWTLPGAEVVIDEPAGPAVSGAGHQISIVARDGDGVPMLTRSLTMNLRPGKAGDAYRQLHEASGSGSVVELSIAGHPGTAVVGPDFNFAVAAIDGWVIDWAAYDPAIDLVAFLESIQSVTTEQWVSAIENVDDVTDEVVAAAGITPVEESAAANLPRFTMPDPWQLEWVTDTGIWTPEQRAQRDALDQAHSTGVPYYLPAMSQGFRSSSSPDGPGIAIPELIIRIARTDDEAPRPDSYGFGGDPIDAFGLSGTIYPEGTLMGFGAGLDVAGSGVLVSIQTTDMSERELRSFIEQLTPRQPDLTLGFDLDSNRYQQLFELQNEQAETFTESAVWHASWRSTDESRSATVSVERQSLGELQSRLMHDAGFEATLIPMNDEQDYALVHDTAALAERGIYFMDAEDGEVMLSTGEARRRINPPRPRATIIRYDEASQVVIRFSLSGTPEEALAALDQMIEVDLETWRELAGPYNSDPLKPR